MPIKIGAISHYSVNYIKYFFPEQWWVLPCPSSDTAASTVLFLFFFFKGPHLWHMEAPRLGVESGLQLPAYTTAKPDPSCVCDLHWQLMAMPNPQPTEQGQGSNPHPHGYQSGSPPLNYNRNSYCPYK